MANFTYVGEEGAKQLYRHIKAIIPIVDTALDEHSDNPISNSVVTEQLSIINERLANFTSYLVVEGDQYGQPDVQEPSTKYIYLVKVEESGSPLEDIYSEWIWCVPQETTEPATGVIDPEDSGEEANEPEAPYWQCIGTTATQPGAIDSWKQWSLENQCSANDSNSIFIGIDNELDQQSMAFGYYNRAYGYSMLWGIGNITDSTGAKSNKNHASIIGYYNSSSSDLATYYGNRLLTNSEVQQIQYEFYADFTALLNEAYDFLINEMPFNPNGQEVTTSDVEDWYEAQMNRVTNILEKYEGNTPLSPTSSSLDEYLSTNYITLFKRPGETALCTPIQLMNDSTLDEFNHDTAGWPYEYEEGKKSIASTVISDYSSYFSPDFITILQKFVDQGEAALNSVEWYTIDLFMRLGTYGSGIGTPLDDATISKQSDAKKFFYYACGIEFFIETANEYTIAALSHRTTRDDLMCSSILIGATNESNHHNSILIGHNNKSFAPIDAKGKTFYTDDDGFGIAIGNGNIVGRNYDIAMGFNSIANGGENIAIQQSSATGYRNIALESSYISGIANIALNESSVVNNGFESNSPYLSRNFLSSSKVNIDNRTDGQMMENLLVNSNVDMFIDDDGDGMLRNQFLMVPSTYNGDTFTVQSRTLIDNVFIGGHSSPWSSSHNSILWVNGNIDRNISIHNYYEIEQFDSINDNFITGSEIYLYATEGEIKGIKSSDDGNRMLIGNIIMNSIVYADGVPSNYYTSNNILLQNSVLDITNRYNGLNSTSGNVLISNAMLFAEPEMDILAKDGYPYWSNAPGFSKNSILFGAYGKNLMGCFSQNDNDIPADYNWHSDIKPEDVPDILYHMDEAINDNSLTIDNAWMINSRATINFGGNMIGGANQSFVSGAHNIISNVEYATVHGNQNYINNDDGNSYYGQNPITHITIFGERNRIFNAASSGGRYFFDNRVFGHHNYMTGVYLSQNTIIGSSNDISGLDIPILTVEQIKAFQTSFIQAQIVNYPRYFRISETGNAFIYIPGNPPTSDWILFGGKVYKFIETDWYNEGEDGIRINPIPAIDDYQDIYDALDDYWDAYYYDEMEFYVSNLPTHITPTKDDIGYLVDRATIIGQNNHVGSFNAGHIVIGQENSVINGLNSYSNPNPDDPLFCTGHSLIQGNNNIATSGSNQVVMGNGIYAYGHNSIAIGLQLKSSQWQTVIGKYNSYIAGPERLAKLYHPNTEYEDGDVVFHNSKFYRCIDNVSAEETEWDSNKWEVTDSPDKNKAIFIIGNGYADRDDYMWMDEQSISRSNALEVYADGTIRARRFVSIDDDDATLEAGDGIIIDENIETGRVTISVAPPPDDTKRWSLEWNPVSKKVHWVEVETYIPE